MTEQKKILFIFFFLLSISKAHNSRSAPRVKWSRIQTGQRTDTRERERNRQIKQKSDKFSFILFFYVSSCICLILCNKEKVDSIVGVDGDRKQDKETLSDSF